MRALLRRLRVIVSGLANGDRNAVRPSQTAGRNCRQSVQIDARLHRPDTRPLADAQGVDGMTTSVRQRETGEVGTQACQTESRG